MPPRRLAVVVAFSAALAAGSATGGANPRLQPSPQDRAAAAPAGDAEKGKTLFVKDGCYECHGREAQGSPATGPKLGPNPLPFAAFSKYVRTPIGQMPPYKSAIVSDEDLANIYAFVRTRPSPADIGAILDK